jgi:hypothetical protein
MRTPLLCGRFPLPILNDPFVGSVVEGDDLKRDSLVNDQPTEKQLHCLRHVEAKPMQDIFRRALYAWRHSH